MLQTILWWNLHFDQYDNHRWFLVNNSIKKNSVCLEEDWITINSVTRQEPIVFRWLWIIGNFSILIFSIKLPSTQYICADMLVLVFFTNLDNWRRSGSTLLVSFFLKLYRMQNWKERYYHRKDEWFLLFTS